ncbi:MAG TPA: HAD family phosphatase [Patescibacteria group bacterium]|nr:HAD family phosphatase [Patescibacteria group bacterium]
MIKALIFDFDGVLGSSDIPRFRSLKYAAADVGIDLPNDSIQIMRGRTTLEFLEIVLSKTQKKKMDQIINIHTRNFRNKIDDLVEPIDTTVSFIKHYSGSKKLALATMSGREPIDKLLTKFGIQDKFRTIVCKEDVAKRKPDPEVYLKAIDELGIQAKDSIVIEDTRLGAEAAILSGAKCYILLNGLNDKSDFNRMNISGFISSQKDLELIG